MATKKESTELAPVSNFSLVPRYQGMDPDELAELQDELADLDPENGIACRTIKIPSGGGLAYEVEGDDEGDVDYKKEIVGVIIFTHRMNGYWPNAFGSGEDGNKAPDCSSMDGKTGVERDSGEVHNCDTCPYNQYGSAVTQQGDQGRGKACKNMRRIYLMMSGDPNVYLLSVPPTSIRDLNKKLAKIMAQGIPYTGLLVSLKLEKATNTGGIAYSKAVIEKKGILPADVTAAVKQMRAQVKEQYMNMAVTMDDYTTAPPADQAGANFEEVTGTDAELPFN